MTLEATNRVTALSVIINPPVIEYSRQGYDFPLVEEGSIVEETSYKDQLFGVPSSIKRKKQKLICFEVLGHKKDI